jgi:hypothetical protein
MSTAGPILPLLFQLSFHLFELVVQAGEFKVLERHIKYVLPEVVVRFKVPGDNSIFKIKIFRIT